MTYRGQVINGQIVLNDPVALPEGAAVFIEVAPSASLSESEPLTLNELFAPVIGQATTLPPDASQNVDHYLYGHPKRS